MSFPYDASLLLSTLKITATISTTDFPTDVVQVLLIIAMDFHFNFLCFWFCEILQGFYVFLLVLPSLQFCSQLFMVFKLICGYKRLPACFFIRGSNTNCGIMPFCC